MKALRNAIAALGIAGAGAAGGAHFAPTPVTVHHCAPAMIESADRVPAGALPDATGTVRATLTNCYGSDGTKVTFDPDTGKVVDALDGSGNPTDGARFVR